MEEALIESVRIRTILYDASHEDYLKTKLKCNKWEEVATECNIKNSAEAKALWEKLRHSLRDALRRQQKCVKSGASAEPIKLWKFQKQMEFLQPYMANKNQEGNLSQPISETEVQSQQPDLDDSEKDFTVLEDLQRNHEDHIDQEEDGLLLHSESPPIMTQTPTAAKKTKKTNIAGLLKRSLEQHQERRKLRMEERPKILQQTNTPRDSLYQFLISIYEMTKNMPPSCQFTVRNDIFLVFTNMEAKVMVISTEVPELGDMSSRSNTDTVSYTDLSAATTSSHFDTYVLTNSGGDKGYEKNLKSFCNIFDENS